METVHWREHTWPEGDQVRVWRDGWSWDQWEIVERAEFVTFCTIAEKLGVRVQFHDED